MMSKDLENVTSKEVNRKTSAPLFFLLESFSRECYSDKETLYDEVLLTSECIANWSSKVLLFGFAAPLFL